MGTTIVVDEVIQRDDITVVSHPEFLREGTAVSDFLHPDRVVVGADNREAAEKVAALYSSIDTQVIITDAASAETIKYAANGFLAMKISFVNAVAAMCEAVGADVVDVVEGNAGEGDAAERKRGSERERETVRERERAREREKENRE